MNIRVLWVLSDEYFIGRVSERFKITAEGKEVEYPARRAYCLVLNGDGSISSSALGLAKKFGVPVVLVCGNDVHGFTWIVHNKPIEPVLYQVHAYLNVKEFFSSLFLEVLRKNYEKVLGIKLEGGLNEVREKIMRTLEERWSHSAKSKAEYARLLLSCVCWAALYRAGLNPNIGFLHNKLCFDLACEFEHKTVLRAVVVPDMNETELRKAVAKSVDEALQETVEKGTLSSRPHSLLWHINVHAKSLASTLRSGLFSYRPFREDYS